MWCCLRRLNQDKLYKFLECGQSCCESKFWFKLISCESSFFLKPSLQANSLFLFQDRVSQQGFWQPMAESIFNEAFVVMGQLKWGLSALLAWINGKVKTSPSVILPSSSTLSIFSIYKQFTLFPPSKPRLHKSQFLQKLSCQNPYCDLAILPSLVNKKVDKLIEQFLL